MISHNAVLQTAALVNKPTLKELFPNSEATGAVYIPTSNITICYINPDNKDTLAS